jgi:hypothetical protein
MSMKPRFAFSVPAAFLLLMPLAGRAAERLNESRTVSLLNRTAQVRKEGSRILPSVPGNRELLRAWATCIENGVTKTAESELFSRPAEPGTTGFTAATRSASPSPSAPPDQPTATTRPISTSQQLFQRRKHIVEVNCGDCLWTASSPKELLEGIELLKQALQQGYSDEAAIHRLLILAYSNAGMPELRQSEITALHKSDPSDLDARMDWIGLSTDDDQVVAELRKTTVEAPRFARAHYLFAVMFFSQRNLEEGTKSVRRWLDTGSQEEIVSLSDGVFVSLRVEDLKKILKADSTIYPAHAVIALQLIGRRDGKDDVQGAVEHARMAIAAAPPGVALYYESSIGGSLRDSGHKNEAAALHREFAAKLKSARDH